MFEIKKIIHKGDYLYALVPDHPYATKNGYVLLHRVVLENHLGRLLDKSEVVHHKDGNKLNNSVDNLEVLTQSEHAKIHAKVKHTQLYSYVCPECGITFEKRFKLSYEPRKYGVFCSRKCSGRFSARKKYTTVS